MKQAIITILRMARIYHPLQSGYRSLLNRMRKLYYRLAYSRYRGTGFSCNFCGAVYQHFVPEYPGIRIRAVLDQYQVIAGYGDNVFCPGCMSKNRERLLKAVLTDHVVLKGKKILHCSPEPALHQFLKHDSNIITADLEPGFYRSVNKDVQFADVTALPFEDESIDIIVANHILEHIPDDIQAISEFHRVIKTGGLAILQVPYSEVLPATLEDKTIKDPHQQEKLFGQKDHVRIYALPDYLSRVKQCGFKVTVLSPASLAIYQKHAIQETESVFIFYK
ncbi:MAG: SAM-dependent methyltransferase [Sphingobacteriales bacterium]|nr:MAG: SAM-dependent methyltransferase [Sphingobacteriales bacterium]